MKEKGTSVFENGLIWFGAAVSIAEIMTGTYFAPLGLFKGITAILIGHAIGFALMLLTGLIGAETKKSSMETVKLSFGYKGALFFSIVNIIQLAGWTAIMIYDGSKAANSIFNIGSSIWCIVIGLMIIIWILIGIKNLGKVNIVAMTALFVLTVVLGFIIFSKGVMQNITEDSITFGAAVELSVAMPLSWLPLISDYTREAKKPYTASAVSAVTYGIVSCFMYIIGMGATMFTKESDIAQIMVKSGLGVSGLIIIVFSTVTTTFLDAYSAGVSGEVITKKINSKWLAVLVTVIGAVVAIFFPITDITDFLYFIGSVFAPMIAVLITDFYILKRDKTDCAFDIKNAVSWILGFVIYRLLMKVNIIVGCTLAAVLLTIIISVVSDFIERKIKNERN